MRRVASPGNFTSTAVADQRRPAEDREDDANRQPGELLAFAQVSTAEKIGDFLMGGGYITRLLAAAITPNGQVYAFRPVAGATQQALAAQHGSVELFGGTVRSLALPRG